jgi:hypothetical protein
MVSRKAANERSDVLATRASKALSSWVAQQAQRYRCHKAQIVEWALSDAKDAGWVPSQFRESKQR